MIQIEDSETESIKDKKVLKSISNISSRVDISADDVFNLERLFA